MRPSGGAAGEELRLGAALLPLRLRLDQAVVDFLQVRQAPIQKLQEEAGPRVLVQWAWTGPPWTLCTCLLNNLARCRVICRVSSPCHRVCVHSDFREESAVQMIKL